MTYDRFPHFGVLLVDDEPAFIRSLSLALERHLGVNHLYRCTDSREAMAMISKEPIGLVLLDLTMPHVSGKSLLESIVEEYPAIKVIVISGMNQLETAMDCVRKGAYDYFVKTTEQSRMLDGIRRAIRMQEVNLENQEMRRRFFSDQLDRPEVFAEIITQDKGMHAVFQYLESISKSSQPVLIGGESGTGKEAIAKAIHELSERSGPLVSINVAGLDDNVFADSLFGHHRGAFTGAEKSRAGMVEQAGSGTLFLDEIGDLSLASQVKLLRLIQEGEYFPLGADRPKLSRARIVVATHQNLEQLQYEGRFRKDLYYRLKTHQVELPPLRNRKGDIELLLHHFLNEAAEDLGKAKPTFPKELPALLANYGFPGNIRELRALCFEAVSRHQSKVLSMEVFRSVFTQAGELPEEAGTESPALFEQLATLPTIQEASDLLVNEAMRRAGGNQSIASRLLGISQPALSKRIRKSNASADD
ncbi:sigma-54-dependent transcriptional regulator [Reinekea marinisedimentorum]|uniref:DNA-binding NtrC family response regulator n=1 Tax=Reinekea marinisedimentorum TaxID=230495 RepID=A0A4R3I5U5_9GAMM|nr:sigma-54 dependent transcriptional regulator [Reinekea marinisedimentorum]TCS41068.1 DNA-binding NtrC family response regulator [Reinekea marinisedimentorum]